ncbi:DUF481 domain-containing protein [Marinomonas sp.]|uniref:DUF481 domain-containing protein n=1 Tax=Marinomonas sp. TaxID=1904862 RepID=UPI003C710282
MKARYHLPFIALLATQAVHAAENETTPAKKTNPQNKTQKPWQGSVELGVILTTGNSDTTNINSKFNVVQQLETWRNTYTFTSLYANSDDTKTEEQYRGAIQSDYIFNDHQFWYIRGAYDKNLFSGYDYQSSASTGYGNRFWQEEDGSYLEGSVGGGYRNNKIDEDNTTDDSERIPIVRFSGTYEKHLSTTSLFKQELNTEIGTENGSSITESVSSLQANVVDNLAMKVSYRVKYSSDVPADTEKTDTETTVSMLYSF